eukprot:1950522-Lingulodinium_polyedra.AAC.1
MIWGDVAFVLNHSSAPRVQATCSAWTPVSSVLRPWLGSAGPFGVGWQSWTCAHSAFDGASAR